MSKKAKIDVKNKVKLTEMITIGYMQKSRKQGVTKKMLHVPTMTLFTVKEESIANQQIAKVLQTELSQWKLILSPLDNFIKIHELFWNVPQKHVSIATDYMVGSSLKDLLESSYSISEQILRVIGY